MASTAAPNAASPVRRPTFGRFGSLIGRRLRFIVIQLIGAATAAFFLIRLVPGDPAKVLAGPGATPATLAELRRYLGLDDPLPVQYVKYLGNLLRGDMGTSITSGRSVFDDLVQRAPATLELITYALLISLAIGIPLGIALARRREKRSGKAIFGYAMFSGSVPDFWLALILLFFFSFTWQIFPPPIGRLGFAAPPGRITGFYTLDALMHGDLGTFWLAARHLVLPVLTLTLVYSGLIVKVANAASEQAFSAGFTDLYSSAGVKSHVVLRRATRLAMPPIVTVAGITYGFLLGGAVLVEQIFSWGGVGQYAVQSIRGADFAAIQGFILLAALFNIVNYLLVDIALLWVDPRLGRTET